MTLQRTIMRHTQSRKPTPCTTAGSWQASTWALLSCLGWAHATSPSEQSAHEAPDMEQHGSSGVMASLPSLKSSGPLCTTNREEITIVSSNKRLTRCWLLLGTCARNTQLHQAQVRTPGRSSVITPVGTEWMQSWSGVDFRRKASVFKPSSLCSIMNDRDDQSEAYTCATLIGSC